MRCLICVQIQIWNYTFYSTCFIWWIFGVTFISVLFQRSCIYLEEVMQLKNEKTCNITCNYYSGHNQLPPIDLEFGFVDLFLVSATSEDKRKRRVTFFMPIDSPKLAHPYEWRAKLFQWSKNKFLWRSIEQMLKMFAIYPSRERKKNKSSKIVGINWSGTIKA